MVHCKCRLNTNLEGVNYSMWTIVGQVYEVRLNLRGGIVLLRTRAHSADEVLLKVARLMGSLPYEVVSVSSQADA